MYITVELLPPEGQDLIDMILEPTGMHLPCGPVRMTHNTGKELHVRLDISPNASLA